MPTKGGLLARVDEEVFWALSSSLPGAMLTIRRRVSILSDDNAKKDMIVGGGMKWEECQMSVDDVGG